MNLDMLIRRAAKDPRWEPRFHAAIGMIQLFLTSKADRLHVWHPSLPATRPDSDIHNHRFSFDSTILRGRLVHEVIGPIPGHNWNLWRTHQDPGGEAELVSVCNISRLTAADLREGDSYHFEAGRFHRSSAFGLTITRMRKTWDNPAQPVFVLAKPGIAMSHAFSSDLPRPTVARLWELLEDATKGLEIDG